MKLSPGGVGLFLYINFGYLVHAFAIEHYPFRPIAMFIFHFTCWMVYVCFFRTWATSPGHPPHISNKDIVCDKCDRWKPERAHHCSQCQRCVLRMDHHCPWTGNCIGFYNYKFYVLLVFYGTVSGLNILLISFSAVFDTLFHDRLMEKDWLLIVHYVAIIFLFCACSFLFYDHLCLSLKNQTTIERYQMTPEIYDLGWFENLKCLFGDSIFLWPFPIAPTARGYGLIYQRNKRMVED